MVKYVGFTRSGNTLVDHYKGARGIYDACDQKSIQVNEPAALQDLIEDSSGQILVMEQLSRSLSGLLIATLPTRWASQ